jgi:hypothetical protein
MNPSTRILRQSRRAMAPGIDHLESRQLLSTILKPVHGAVLAHHHEALRPHHAAEVGRAHSTHHGKTAPAATPATSTGFSVVAQFNNADFNATVAIADNDIWAVGESNPDSSNGQPLAVHFNGTSWSTVATPTLSGGAAFTGVAAVASNDVWAVGLQQTGNVITALIENWNGTSWSVVPSPNISGSSESYLTAVTAISTNNVYAAGIGGPSGALIEHWNGTSWSVVSSPAFNGVTFLYGISADSSNDVWAVGEVVGKGGPVLHFNGTSWSLTYLPDSLYHGKPGTVRLDAVAALSPTDVWAVASGQTSSTSPVPYSDHWNGTSWSGVSSPKILEGIAAISANDIWAVGINGIANWNGTSWSIVSALPSGVSYLSGVAALSDGTVVAVGNGTNSSGVSAGFILEN